MSSSSRPRSSREWFFAFLHFLALGILLAIVAFPMSSASEIALFVIAFVMYRDQMDRWSANARGQS